MIKAYGLHWKPEWIYGYNGQSARKSFIGLVKKGKKKHEIDFWTARGVYALFKDFELVYMGKVPDMSLGTRIASHWRTMKDHWNTFSFYCFSDIDTKKGAVVTRSGKIITDRGTAIKTLEAIIINTAVPFNNKQEARFPKSHKVTQVQFLKPDTIDEVIERLDLLEKRLFPKKRRKTK